MEEEIQKTLEVLKSGGTILYPTDTIWGIGCDATNDEAIRKIIGIKKRHESKSFVTLVDSIDMLYDFVREVPPVAQDLIAYTTKPLTIIYSGAIKLSSLAVAEDGSAGIRVTTDPFCKALIRKLRKPIISTSANISGGKSPETFADVPAAILDAVDYVVNLRQEEDKPAQPSTIIKLEVDGTFRFIRK